MHAKLQMHAKFLGTYERMVGGLGNYDLCLGSCFVCFQSQSPCTVNKRWKGQCHKIFDLRFSRFFASGFFHESVSPKPLSLPLGSFRIFSKIGGDYYQLKVHHRCRWHWLQMAKIFNQKSFNYFFTHLGRRVNIWINLLLQVHFKVSAVWYCSHYFPPVLLTLVANLPSALIPVAICQRRNWHRWQIRHRYQKHQR